MVALVFIFTACVWFEFMNKLKEKWCVCVCVCIRIFVGVSL